MMLASARARSARSAAVIAAAIAFTTLTATPAFAFDLPCTDDRFKSTQAADRQCPPRRLLPTNGSSGGSMRLGWEWCLGLRVPRVSAGLG